MKVIQLFLSILMLFFTSPIVESQAATLPFSIVTIEETSPKKMTWRERIAQKLPNTGGKKMTKREKFIAYGAGSMVLGVALIFYGEQRQQPNMGFSGAFRGTGEKIIGFVLILVGAVLTLIGLFTKKT
jgi:uncharacterized membrane protein